jgi:hypothetical protein
MQNKLAELIELAKRVPEIGIDKAIEALRAIIAEANKTKKQQFQSVLTAERIQLFAMGTSIVSNRIYVKLVVRHSLKLPGMLCITHTVARASGNKPFAILWME